MKAKMISSNEASGVGKEILGCFLSLDLNESTSLIRPFSQRDYQPTPEEGDGGHPDVVDVAEVEEAPPWL